MLRLHAISDVEPGRRGIHVLFSGPPAWLLSPAGWLVERRLARRGRIAESCAIIDSKALAELRRERELATPIGIATLRDGLWLGPGSAAAGTAEVLAIDLAAPATTARVSMEGPNWTAYALAAGKVVAASPAQLAAGQVRLNAARIERIVVHAQHAAHWQVCAGIERDDEAGWQPIARLQMPIREFDLSLVDADAEFALVKSRLLEGDALDQAEFGDLAEALRPLASFKLGRPIDLASRADPASPENLIGALDPLRFAMLDPALRRVVGLAHFDQDPQLVDGESYQYRVSTRLPADADRARPGFCRLPVGTLVPGDFYLGDIQVRLARPSRVDFAPLSEVGEAQVGRKFVPIASRSHLWLLPDLEDAALVLDFAAPRSSLVLEMLDADLEFAAEDPFGGPLGVSATPGTGEFALAFSGPCARLIVRGEGRWLGLRETDTAMAPVAAFTQPVRLAPSPAPPAPAFVTAASTNSAPQNGTAPRSELGFDVAWQPAPAFDITAWPPDAEGAPPLEAARFEVEHAGENEPFANLYGVGGAAFGQRAASSARPSLVAGADVMALFPEEGAPGEGAGSTLTLRDQFERDPPMPSPRPGSMHRYRVRSLDEIGRPGAWTTSAPTRLEKHAPPPVPVGPPRDPASQAPMGVHARVLVRDAPDLTDAERAVLDQAGATSAVLLRWGWTAEQRALDPWAREFRVYLSGGGVGPVAGQITAIADQGNGHFSAALTLARPVAADAARGFFLPAGGEYRILGHGAGSIIQAELRTRLPRRGAYSAPRLGPTTLPVPWLAQQSRPAAWEERAAIVPITDAESYEHALFDRLLPSAEQPSAMLWMGVSAADAEDYIADTRPGGGRVGNESPIAAVRCEARYHGRPTLDAPPPIGEVPVIASARSTASGVEQDIDLAPFLAHAPLAGGEPVVVEWIEDGALLAALRADNGALLALPSPQGPRDALPQPITVPNSGDRAAILAALDGPPAAMADRFLPWLAAHHPFADWLFAPLPGSSTIAMPVRLVLPAGGARYLFRMRRVDAAGHLSAGAAVCAMVLRVPALAPLAPPDFAGARWLETSEGERLEVTARVADGRATHLLSWIAAADPRRAALATIGSRRDLPGFGVRLRLADGSVVEPAIAPLEAAPGERAIATHHAIAGGPHFLWLALVDRDGVPSSLAGGYRLPALAS